jgi:putative pyrroloquinoline-quinone binding quinoprotein/putative pyrroloquinoline-quinone-binding quinoprotein
VSSPRRQPPSGRARAVAAPLVLVAVLLGLASFVLTTAGEAAAAAAAERDWLAYGRTPDVANAATQAIRPVEVMRMRARWTAKLDGSILAQPLHVAEQRIAGRRGSLLVVVSGGNSVYALWADNGDVLWRRSLGEPVFTVCGARAGISSTPTVDWRRRLVYVAGAGGEVHALDLVTGHEKAGWPLRVSARPAVEYVWSALRFVGWRLYVPVASHCDRPDDQGAHADGRVVAVDRFRGRIERVFDVVPGPANLGGVWAPGGISVDPLDGTLWAGTGNAHVVVEGSLRADAAHAERVLRLTPALRVRGSAPQTFQAAENLGDQGFGSTPLLFRPTGCDPVAAANSKNGAMYVWRRSPWRPAPIFTARIGPTEPHDPFLSQPTWFPQARALVVGQGIVDREGGRVRGVVGFRVDASCRFRLDWVVNIGPGPTVQPLAAGSTAYVPAPQLGKLAAVDVARGRLVRLFDTGQVLASPIAVGGTLFVASADGTVRAYR